MTPDDPLEGSGIEVVTVPILLLDEHCQQLREEASDRGCNLESVIAQLLRAHIVRCEIEAEAKYPSE
jgi:hypothetical protein